VRAKKIRLAKLFPTLANTQANIGQLNGEIALNGHGDSVRDMLAHANGKLGLVVAGGEVSRLMMEQAGLHLWEILQLKVKGDQLVRLRCAVADFNVSDGIMQTEALVFDTEITTIIGDGQVDLGNEALHLTLNPKTKNTSPLALRSPIYIRGSFAKPDVQVDKGRVALRGLGAVALATINPVLLLLPLVDPGPGKDSDCRQLVRDTRKVASASTAKSVMQ
jgi:AsmA protein